MVLTVAEENYLKAIYAFSCQYDAGANNQSIAEKLKINPASVTDMLHKLEEKKLIRYSRSEGASLTRDGLRIAVKIVRKHRLWETFLVKNMDFKWDEVHEVAEQLEHIQSDKLLSELDRILGYPKFDPHGDPIPDVNGNLPVVKARPLTEAEPGRKVKVVNVLDNTPAFLKYLDKHGIGLNDPLLIKEIEEFDHSVLVELKNKKEIFLSQEAAQKIFVE